MGRKKEGQLTIENLRKHEVTMSEKVTLPPLGKKVMSEEAYRKAIADNPYLREAVNKNFIKVKKA